ncbi:MAG: DedA family protein [Solirubrobacteraceae bacterium]|nr:DedA family protein [Solirubrobacteraceae bacterium]
MPLSAILVAASMTDKLAEWVTSVVGDLGLPGIFLLMTLESMCVPVPSEPTMLFAGFNVSEGTYSFWAVVAVAVGANVVGSWIAYGAGRFGRLELIERHGKWLHVKPSHIEWADRWFERYGDVAVFFSRMLPIVRTFISLPAGVARMPFWRFTVLTTLGCIPWMAALTFLGLKVGENWEDLRAYLHWLDYAVLAAIVAGVVWLAVRWRRARTRAADAPAG